VAILDSRYIGMIDIPESQEITANFTYNFFVPDERTNRTGSARFHGIKNERTQRLIKTKVLQTQLPRFVEIMFDPVNCGNGNIEDLQDQPILSDPTVKGKTNTEDTLTTEKDVIYRFADRSVRARLTDKARMLANILNEPANNVPQQITAILGIDETINAEELQEVLSPESTPGVEYVNDLGELNEPDIFTLAASLKLDVFLDRRLLRASLGGDYTHESILKTENVAISKKDAVSFLPTCSTDAADNSFEPTFSVIKEEEVKFPSDEVQTVTVGYIVDRSEVSEAGKFMGNKRFLLDDVSSTNFLDTQIAYGSTYTYTVRTVALVEMVMESDGKDNEPPGFYKTWSLVSSRPSKRAIVEAIERKPPLEPDGVFYRFNYGEGGLVIRWQIPTGKQRDVKYFQIFRRKTIYEPFTCIAELDFDDSTIPSTRRERVNPDRVFKFKAPITQFIDPEYTRESSFIYAVVALDAHGLTSGYSAQSLVTFNRTKNTIELKNISRSGAAKQYPNFFIDPDLDDNIFVDSLTQDAMLSSHKRKMKIYFDPDAAKFTSSDGRDGNIILTKNNEDAVYKLLLLNIDRQKSATFEIFIENLGQA